MQRTFAIALAFLVLAPATAAAQAPSGEYSGGGLAGSRNVFVGSSEIGLVVDGAAGTVAVRAAGVIPCRFGGGTGAEGTGAGRGAIAPDGTFRFTLGRGDQRITAGYRQRVVVTGRVEAGRATGTLEIVARLRRRTCRGSVGWAARPAPTLGTEGGAAPAGAVLLGRTSGRTGGPFAFALRVSRDGRRVTKGVFSFRRRCRTLKRFPEETNYVPAMRVRADGSFRDVDRFTQRFADATERYVITVTGRFVAGGAIGTARLVSVARSRRTGRVIDRCDSGRLRWAAAP